MKLVILVLYIPNVAKMVKYLMKTKSSLSICFVTLNGYAILTEDLSIKHVGGAELQQVTLAKELAKRGYKVSMICMGHGQVDGIIIDGVTVYKAYRPTEGIPVFRYFHPRLTSVWSAMKRADADIYYQRAAGQLTGIVAKFCQLYKKKSIYSGAHNDDFLLGAPKVKYKRDKWLFRFGLLHMDNILTQNIEQQKLLKDNFGRESVVINNVYTPPTVRTNNKNGYILWVSTLREFKQPQIFIELAKALPQFKFKLVGGVGHGEVELYNNIQAQAENIANLEFCGFVPISQVDSYYDGARLFINTSRSEGFPNSFLQAWARKIPTISFFDCGARCKNGEHVSELVTCQQDMIVKVCEFMTENDVWAKSGLIAADYCINNHSVEYSISKLKCVLHNKVSNL